MKYIYIIHISVPMNKILLEHIHLCVFCGCFHATMHTQLSSCDKDHMPHKLKILSSLLQKTFADPCSNCLVLFTFLGPGKKKNPTPFQIFLFYMYYLALVSRSAVSLPKTFLPSPEPSSNLEE